MGVACAVGLALLAASAPGGAAPHLPTVRITVAHLAATAGTGTMRLPAPSYARENPGTKVTGQVVVSPTLLQLPAARRGSHSVIGQIVVRNHEPRPTTFRLVVEGVVGTRSPTRRVRFLHDGDPAAARTAAPWVQLPTSSVTLLPLQRATIAVGVNVPTDAAAGGHYAAVAIRGSAAVHGSRGADVGIQTDVAVPLLITVRGPVHERFALRDVRAPGWISSGAQWRVDADVDNTGDVHFVPAGSLTVRNVWGHVVAQLPVRGRLVLPGGRTGTHVTWRGAPLLGFYRARLRMGAGGGGALAQAQVRTLWVLPPWWLGVLVLVAIALLVWRRWRRRAERRRSLLAEVDTYV